MISCLRTDSISHLTHLTHLTPLTHHHYRPIQLALENERHQAKHIASEIQRLHAEGLPLGEMAVLSRTHHKVGRWACMVHMYACMGVSLHGYNSLGRCVVRMHAHKVVCICTAVHGPTCMALVGRAVHDGLVGCVCVHACVGPWG